MGRKDYSKFSQHFKKQNNGIKVNPLEGQVTINEVVEQNNSILEVETNLEDTNVENEANNEVNTISKGIVTGCKALYVREKAFKESEQLAILKENEEVSIVYRDTESEDFYEVLTTSGIQGYCMKKYISIK